MAFKSRDKLVYLDMDNKMKDKTIAELWSWLSKAQEGIDTTESKTYEHFLRGKITPIRAEMLKRCENGIEDKDGDVAEIWGNNRSSIVVQSAHTVLDFSIEQARDFSAAIAFLAWEMEQREKEGKDAS